ncbi:MAG: SAF domain-containing protein [Clostridiales Family XIII bacterium]|jgi:hypothetical protein|nr:SAF domain-containing protein [Clostridiales Family XIII bacterium]
MNMKLGAIIINISGRVKTIGGLLLIIVAVLAFILWEAKGRELITMDEVFVARADISASEPLSEEMFAVVRVPADSKIDKAVDPKGANALKGRMANMEIVSGSQLSKSHLTSIEEKKATPTANFVISSEWIAMRSSSLRRGDEIQIISADGITKFGKYTISYVKDDEEKEISGGENTLGASKADSVRTNASAPIHHVEISCEFSDYMKIREYATKAPTASLLLVSEI